MALSDHNRKFAQMIHALWIACPIRSPHLLVLLLCSTIRPPKYTVAISLIAAAAATNDSKEIYAFESSELSYPQRGVKSAIAVTITEPNADFLHNFNEDDDVFDNIKDYLNDFSSQKDAPLPKAVYDQPTRNDNVISDNGRALFNQDHVINASETANVSQRTMNLDSDKDAGSSSENSRNCKSNNEQNEPQLVEDNMERCSEDATVQDEYLQVGDMVFEEVDGADDKHFHTTSESTYRNVQHKIHESSLMDENQSNYNSSSDELSVMAKPMKAAEHFDDDDDDDEFFMNTEPSIGSNERLATKAISTATTAAILSRFLNSKSSIDNKQSVRQPKDANDDYNEFAKGTPQIERVYVTKQNQKNYDTNMATINNLSNRNIGNYFESTMDKAQSSQNDSINLHGNRINAKLETAMTTTTAMSVLMLPENESNNESYISFDITQSRQDQKQQQHELLERDDQTAQSMEVNKNPSQELLFEKYKEQRRRNQRTGHKTYKKKYKDYLKFGVISSPQTTTMLRDQTMANESMEKYLDDDAILKENNSQHLVANSTKNMVNKNNKQHVLRRWQKYAKKLSQDKQQQENGHLTAPIFALRFKEYGTKPFYQGQINYYQDTNESDEQLVDDNWLKDMNSMHDNARQEQPKHNKKQHRFAVQQIFSAKDKHRQNHYHHGHNHPHHHHNHHRQHQEQDIDKTYQSYGVPMKDSIRVPTLPPQRQPLRELGHQITEVKELEHYYAKWPHLAQIQAYERNVRPTNSEMDDDYGEDYESAAELEEAQNDNNEDANLPPYMKKYNRRNKQLLNLLEGTLPPPSPTTRMPRVQAKWSNSLLQPGPHESSSNAGVIVRTFNDKYFKDKRVHDQNDNTQNRVNLKRFNNIFALQSQMPEPIDYAISNNGDTYNELPDEYVDASNEWLDNRFTNDDEDTNTRPNDNEMNLSSKKSANTQNGSSEMTGGNIRKAALYKVPSYPSIGSSFIGMPRSRSAQFVSNVAGRGNSYINVGGLASDKPLRRSSKTMENLHNSMLERAPKTQKHYITYSRGDQRTRHEMEASTPKSLNSFAYHRVEAPTPLVRNVGVNERKQHLPFVAITDRRLESFKKTLTSSHKDFKKNNLSMP